MSVPTGPRFLPLGDTALSVEFGNEVSPVLHEQVVALDLMIAAAELEGIVETVPTYRSLLVSYDPTVISHAALTAALRGLAAGAHGGGREGGRGWIVPVTYDDPYGTDLAEVADRLGLTTEQVIALHSAAEYRVYMMGFAPGLPYLGGLPEKLVLSRRERPRPQVPAGAVMIGGVQACIVSSTVPSAWYALGHTQVRPFDPGRRNPFLFQPGDRIRFRRISRAAFEASAGQGMPEPLPRLSAAA